MHSTKTVPLHCLRPYGIRHFLRCARWLALAAATGVVGAEATGCSLTPATSVLPERPLWYTRPSGALQVAARRPVTDPNRTIGEDYERGRPALDLGHQRVFVGSSDRGLYALRADDLSTLWRFQTLGVVQSEPLYDAAEDALYFGSNDGALYKVRAIDGTLLWRFESNAEIARKPVLSNGLLYVVNANDTVIAIEPITGKMRWNYHRSPALGMEIAGHSGACVANGKVYAAFSDGHVMAFQALTGEERWSIDLSAEAEQAAGELPRYLDVDTTPIVAQISNGFVVFVAGYAGGVYALDADSGTRVWANDHAVGVTDLMLWQEPAHAPRDGGPIIPPKHMLFASSGSSGFWALSVEDGHEIWHRVLPDGGVSAPVSLAGALLISTTRYGLFLIAPRDGSVIDGIRTGSGFAMTPTAVGQRAFVMSNQGVMLSLQVNAPTAREQRLEK